MVPKGESENSFIFSRKEIDELNKLSGLQNDTYFLKRASVFSLLKTIFHVRNLASSYDICHIHFGSYFGLYCSLVTYKKSKLVITFRGSDLNGSNDNTVLVNILKKMSSQISIFLSDAVILVNSSFKNKIIKKKYNSIILPTGVDLEAMNTSSKEKERKNIYFKRMLSICFYIVH